MAQAATWKCEVCGYIHEGAEPPDECPVCGAPREDFVPFEATAPAPAAAPVEAWRCTVCDYGHEGNTPPDRCPVCGAGASLFEPYEREDTSAGQSDVRQLVIVGAGIAGLTAAEHARRHSDTVAITLLSKEPGNPYYRLNLTRLLAGEIDEADLAIHPDDWYAEQRIAVTQGEAGTIDRGSQRLVLRDGRRLEYDRLVLAMGAHPFIPPISGATRDGIYALRTLEDARAILTQASRASRCVCIGGGLLGLEVAGALNRNGIQVTVLEGFDWLLPRQLAESAALLLRAHLEGVGLAVHCGVRIEEILGDERARGVRLADGREVLGDLVVMGAGIRPNSYLARQSGIDVDKGVIVDDQMFTSDPAILACGDVAEHRGLLYGIWPAAYAQGTVAGANAVGGDLEFRGLAPSNRLKVLDVDLYSIGEFQAPDASYQVLERELDGAYYRLVCRDGGIVGANLYGDTRLAGAIADAVERGTQVRASAELMEKLPQLAALCRGGD